MHRTTARAISLAFPAAMFLCVVLMAIGIPYLHARDDAARRAACVRQSCQQGHPHWFRGGGCFCVTGTPRRAR